MKILIVAATPFEVAPIKQQIEKADLGHQIDILISGIGLVFSTLSLTKKLCETTYDLAVNAGIAGSYQAHLPIGSVVQVVQDELADLAYEEANGNFTTFTEAGFIPENQPPFQAGRLHSSYVDGQLAKANGITVNKVNGAAKSIEKIRAKFLPDIESMEGAAFFYTCHSFNLPCIQVRSISNYVEPRNKSAWDIPLAIRTLNMQLENLILRLPAAKYMRIQK